MAEFLDSHWCDLTWTEFVPFADSLRLISSLPGVYRVRLKSRDQLAYIGQTGRTLRERLLGLRRHTLAEEMPFDDPHTAACRLWSYRDAEKYEYECSAAPVDLPKPERMALECFLIWRYRLELGQSTLCNFGRLHPQYLPSRNRSTGIRGGRLPVGHQNEQVAPCIPPLKLQGDPTTQEWMGVAWRPLEALRGNAVVAVPTTAGVYKLLDNAGRLLYVGESSSLGDRLFSHRQKAWGDREVLFSFCELPELRIKCQRLEIENDLIAGYYSITKQAPAFQSGVG